MPRSTSRPTPVAAKPEEPVQMEPQLRLVCQVGGPFLFSAAHLHLTVPDAPLNIRYSIDFRAVHFDDIKIRIGAPNIDSGCTGTTMRDYLRETDLSPIPDEVIALHDDEFARTR